MTDTVYPLKWPNPKDPVERLDYAVDWSNALSSGETITVVSWTANGGLVIDDQTNTDTQTVVWLTGGTLGQVGTIECTVTTSDGRIMNRSILLRIANK